MNYLNSEPIRAQFYRKQFKFNPKLRAMVARRIAMWYLKQDQQTLNDWRTQSRLPKPPIAPKDLE